MLELNKVYLGDCIEQMKLIKDNSIDAIITDPPYGLGFMGKEWDTFDKSQFGIAGEEGENDLKVKKNFKMLPRIAEGKELQEFTLKWAKECFRVLKPGGHLLSFGGTRTYHRMASAIEDAGFEVRDMIEWVYGSGFPKSLNIANALAKRDGAKRDGAGTQGNTFPIKSEYLEYTLTETAKQYEGWGTALKPAHEPICLARKPLSEKTVAENVLKYGTGGINIDESRVEYNDGTTTEDIKRKYTGNNEGNESVTNNFGVKEIKMTSESTLLGRFPANLIHDNSEEVRECFPDTKTGGSGKLGTFRKAESPIEFTSSRIVTKKEYREPFEGNASRFFKSIIYTAKASKSERNKGCEELETSEKFTAGNYSQSPTCKDCNLTLNGTNDHSKCSGEVYYKEMESKNTKNNHPTVKPIALMEYLIKMVTPKGGIVLDPFAGSGTTLVACKMNGFKFIGIEKTEEYILIIEARLNAVATKINSQKTLT